MEPLPLPVLDSLSLVVEAIGDAAEAAHDNDTAPAIVAAAVEATAIVSCALSRCNNRVVTGIKWMCASCRTARYCCREHMTSDAKKHSKVCACVQRE